jgi:glycerol kinase
MVLDGSGRIVSLAQKEHEQIYPKPGWVEDDPSEIWCCVEAAIREAMEAGALRPSDLPSIINQR